MPIFIKYDGIKGEVVARFDGALPVSDFTTLSGPALVGCSLFNPDEICSSLVFRTATTTTSSESISFNYEEFTTGAMGSTTSFFDAGSFAGFGTYTSRDGAATLTISQVPEAATWLMLIIGFGLIGARMRRRQPVVAA
jgi:hypothetical protein